MLVEMTSGAELLEQVRAAQAELGTGDPAVALTQVEPLLDETATALRDLAFLSRPADDRAYLLEAFCYARVTAVLALQSTEPAAAVPRIRALAAEALTVATPDNSAWKVLSGAAETLARFGDAEGAVRWAKTAARLAPQESYVVQLQGSIRSMFPAVFNEIDL